MASLSAEPVDLPAGAAVLLASGPLADGKLPADTAAWIRTAAAEGGDGAGYADPGGLRPSSPAACSSTARCRSTPPRPAPIVLTDTCVAPACRQRPT